MQNVHTPRLHDMLTVVLRGDDVVVVFGLDVFLFLFTLRPSDWSSAPAVV